MTSAKKDLELLQKITDGAVAQSGPRYTEAAHVDLEIEEVFDGLVRNDRFKKRLLKIKGELFRAFTSVDDLDYFKEDTSITDKFVALKSQLKELNATSAQLQFDPSFDPLRLELPMLTDLVHKAAEALQTGLYSYKPNNRSGFNSSYGFKSEFQQYEYYFRKFLSKLYEFHQELKADPFKAYCNPSIWVTSAAGFGKTHLICDFCKSSIREVQPVVFLLGQQIPDQDIWSHLCRRLKLEFDSLDVAKAEFLKYAKLTSELFKKKFVIVIDALNEGIGKTYWPERINQFQTAIAEHSFLALIVSCRTTYEHLIKPSSDWLIIKHRGFENNIFAATKRYFESYKIVGHEIPLLGEFRNPLFLKTYCEALKGEDLRIMRGHFGIKMIHEAYFKKIDYKIAKELGYQSGQLTSHLFAKKIALEMAKTGNEWVSIETFNETVLSYKKEKSISGDFQFELLNEGLFTRDFVYDFDSKQTIESIRFSFQKFSDIFVARELLTISNLTNANMAEEFSQSPAIKKIFEKSYQNKSLIEALAAIVPEYTEGGKELIELATNMADEELLFEATLDSLVWRELKAYPDISKLGKVFRSIINSEDRYRKFLGSILSVSTTPEHPLNSNFLSAHLIKQKMPERDSKWLQYLHYAYDDGSVVTRTVEWAWNLDFNTISKDSLCLYAQVICWFLVSSHRFLRDRATKALVLIFSNVPELALQMTKRFIGIDDDYVIERIIIASYGSFSRNRQVDFLFQYADFVYERYFVERKMPTNVSIRFYSKRLIILAKELGWSKKLNIKNLKPPFNSEWPVRISTAEEINAKYKSASWDSMDPQWGYNSIHTSVMSWGDFARYEIGTDHESSWVKKDFVPVSQRKLRLKRTLKNKEEKTLFEVILKGYEKTYFREAEFTKILALAEAAFLKRLSTKEKDVWNLEIKPFLGHGTEKPERLPLSTVQAMIMDRIDSMGYSVELHGLFDRYMTTGDAGRSPDKPERIGKKYQWISFFNVMGIICDHYNYFGYNAFSDDPGIDELRFIKHIDPTIAIRSKVEVPDVAKANSIVFPQMNDWKPELNNVEWLKDGSDFIDIEKLIIQNDDNGDRWILVDGGHSFQEEAPPDQDKFSIQRRDVFYVINACLFRRNDEQKVLKFLEQVNYTNRWMPESHDQIDPHFAEFAFKKFRKEMPSEKLCGQKHREIPFPFSLLTEQYLYERGTYDCSIDETMHLTMPSFALSDKMKIEGRNFDGIFRLKGSDDVVAFNLKGDSPHGFLFRWSAFERFLKDENLGIFWSILSERRMIGGNHNDSPGRHDLSSSLIYLDGRFKEIGRKVTYRKFN